MTSFAYRLSSLQDVRPFPLQAVTRLLSQCLHADSVTEAGFARRVLLDPQFDAAGAFQAIGQDNEIAGFVLAIRQRRPLEDTPADRARGWITLFAVAPGARRSGVGTALLEAAEGWLWAQGCAEVWVSPYGPGYWTPGVDEAAYPSAIALLASRGYETRYRPLSMEVSLEEWRLPEWAARRIDETAQRGIEIVPFLAADASDLSAFLRREFPGDWQRHLRETMMGLLEQHRSSSDLLIARDGSRECIGFAQCEGERFGPFGVASARRGEGTGSALLYLMLESMRQRGRRSAWFMWTDDRNADRIYRPAGFQETRRYSVMRKVGQ